MVFLHLVFMLKYSGWQRFGDDPLNCLRAGRQLLFLASNTGASVIFHKKCSTCHCDAVLLSCQRKWKKNAKEVFTLLCVCKQARVYSADKKEKTRQETWFYHFKIWELDMYQIQKRKKESYYIMCFFFSRLPHVHKELTRKIHLLIVL